MRKRAAKKRPLLPDPKFNDQLVTRFVNNLMWDGKKSTAFKVFYDAMEIVETKKNNDEKSSLEVWKDALTNVMPHVEVRSRRVGGATFQIPMQIRPDRKISMAMKWMLLYARRNFSIWSDLHWDLECCSTYSTTTYFYVRHNVCQRIFPNF